MTDGDAHKSNAGDGPPPESAGGSSEDVLALLAEIDAVCGGGTLAPAPMPIVAAPPESETDRSPGPELAPSAMAEAGPEPAAAPTPAASLPDRPALDPPTGTGREWPEAADGLPREPDHDSRLDLPEVFVPAGSFEPPEPPAPGEPEPSPPLPARADAVPADQVAPGDEAPAPAANDHPLRRMDDALAGDVEELLQGEFETVSAVLEDFDDTGTAPAEPAAEVTPAARDETGEEMWSGPEPLPAREPLPERPGPTAKPAAPCAEPESMPLPARDPIVKPEPVAVDAPSPPASEPDPEPDPAPDPEPDPEPVAEPGAAEEAPAVAGTGRGRPLVAALESATIAVLRIVNAPLRLVPSRLHPVVDWIALSLVFWVPIVWVFALLVVGR